MLGFLWVAGASAVAAVLAYAVRRFGADEGRDANNDTVGNVFTLVGGLHAVLMAFVLIALFDAAGTASDDAYREANSLVAVTWAGESLPEPTRSEIMRLTQDYATTVIEREWPRMREGEEVDGTGWAQLDQLRLAIEGAQPADDWQQERRLEAAGRLWEVYQARQDRLNAGGDGVSTVVWFALVAGSFLAIALPFLFGGTRLVSYVIVVATLTATITLLMFAIYQMQNPFSGGSSIEPAAFESALQRLG